MNRHRLLLGLFGPKLHPCDQNLELPTLPLFLFFSISILAFSSLSFSLRLRSSLSSFSLFFQNVSNSLEFASLRCGVRSESTTAIGSRTSRLGGTYSPPQSHLAALAHHLLTRSSKAYGTAALMMEDQFELNAAECSVPSTGSTFGSKWVGAVETADPGVVGGKKEIEGLVLRLKRGSGPTSG